MLKKLRALWHAVQLGHQEIRVYRTRELRISASSLRTLQFDIQKGWDIVDCSDNCGEHGFTVTLAKRMTIFEAVEGGYIPPGEPPCA